MTARRLLVAVVVLAALPLAAVRAPAGAAVCSAPAYVTRTISTSAEPLPATPILRFVNLSDSHIIDDEASPVITGNYLEAGLEPAIGNGSAQRLQEEYTDEVLNAMAQTINACHEQEPLELMIATGDLTDNQTLNETRRYIDNLDGVSGIDTMTAYEQFCGYTTHDSNGRPKAGAGTCTDEMRAAFALHTGKLVADSRVPDPDANDPTYQLTPTRSARQIAETYVASVEGGSHFVAPGLPASLRCDAGAPGCANARLAIPHYAVFGNHDGAVRGTVTMQQPFQAGTYAVGRYFFESQREFINEWFHTTPLPGPIGHGFGHAGARLADADDRNDGYYAFDAGTGGAVRMVVLNTIYDGVERALHRDGATGDDTGGLVAGNEVTNPIGVEQGVLSAAQYAWLEAELTAAAAAGKPVLVFSHHPDRSFTDRRLGFAADGGKTSVQVDELLGRASFAGNANTLVAWIAGHTHENIVKPCAPTACPIGSSGPQPTIQRGFWRIETSSLVDYPQEGRVVELFALPNGGYALRLTMIAPDRDDVDAALSYELSKAEAVCTTSAIMGGPASSGPHNAGRVQEIVTNAGEAAVQQKFCRGEDSLAAAAGGPGDRDVVLYP